MCPACIQPMSHEDYRADARDGTAFTLIAATAIPDGMRGIDALMRRNRGTGYTPDAA